LAAYKIPDRIEFITAFPQTSVGKVSKKALREMITQQKHLHLNRMET
jgi:2,3-dihydroxybenzoate-AMP ligase